jgi:hypothetical protein
MKQKGGKFQSNYKMEHISNINGVVNQNKIVAKGDDSGINIITQKNNNKPEHIFINLDQFVNKLDRGENDMFFKLRQLMDKEEYKSHPLILKNSLPNKLKKQRKAAKKQRKAAKKQIKANKKDEKNVKKKRKTNKKWKRKKNKTLKKKQPSLFDVF